MSNMQTVLAMYAAGAVALFAYGQIKTTVRLRRGDRAKLEAMIAEAGFRPSTSMMVALNAWWALLWPPLMAFYLAHGLHKAMGRGGRGDQG